METLYKLLNYLINPDYRDYRKLRTLHVFEPDYFTHLLRRYRPESYARINEFEDPFWLYFLVAREELAAGDFSRHSWHQCCDPHPLFDTCYYVSRNARSIGTRNPFAHYLAKGWKQGLRPSPYFDPPHYAALSGWSETAGDPLTHYTHHGLKDAISHSSFFNDDHHYVDQGAYTEIVHANPIKHYKIHGGSRGKSPIPVFDAHAYLKILGDSSDAGADPFLHYICAGESRGIRPNEHFDVAYYKYRYPETAQCESPLLHYYKIGVHRRAEINERVAALARKPVISIVVPVYNPKARHLRNCIRSVLYQSYPYWELCLVDDCSDNEATREVMRSWAERDERITCRFNQRNQGISQTTQRGIEATNGEFIGLLDNDDELALDCLFQIAQAINETDGKLFYTDEDLVGDDGSRLSTFYKPAFNKALLYSHNYITHFVVASRMAILAAGGLASECDGAQDYDLVLKLADSGKDFQHIPRALYHWRAAETSTSIAHDQKPYAHEAGRKALTNCLKRNGIEGRVSDGPINFHYRIHLAETDQPTIAVIVAGKEGRADGVDEASIRAKTGYEHALFHWLDESAWTGPGASTQDTINLRGTGKARAIQEIIAGGTEDYVAILGYGVIDISENWLRELLSKTKLEQSIGIVCGRVNYDGSDGPSYRVAEIENEDAFYYAAFVDAASRHANGLHNMQWVNGCDWHICLISRKVINQVGGLDYHRYPDLMAMLDFSYRAAAAGKTILYTPDAAATLPEKNNRWVGRDAEPGSEKSRFQDNHRAQLLQFERYYPIGLMIENGCDRDKFYRWLAGAGGNQDLTGPGL